MGYRILVDYSQTTEQMLSAGRYDFVDRLVTFANFPHDPSLGAVERSAELVEFPCSVSREEIEGKTWACYRSRALSNKELTRELRMRGLRDATLPELLAFGAQYPRLQQQHPSGDVESNVVARGSVWQDTRGSRYVARLNDRHGSCGVTTILADAVDPFNRRVNPELFRWGTKLPPWTDDIRHWCGIFHRFLAIYIDLSPHPDRPVDESAHYTPSAEEYCEVRVPAGWFVGVRRE